MAQVTHTGNGDVSNTNNLGYSFTFPSLSESAIRVSVNNVDKIPTTDYTIHNWTEAGNSNAYILFTSATARGTGNVRIYRHTNGSLLKHVFQAGSAIKADDLNRANLQALYLAEEAREYVINLSIPGTPVIIAGANLADNSVTTTKILDLQVGTADLSPGAVTDAKIGDLQVTSTKLADNSVITRTIADSQVTSSKLAANSVTTNAIADSQVTSSKLAANSVTTSAIGDGEITRTKIAPANITDVELAATLGQNNSEPYKSGAFSAPDIIVNDQGRVVSISSGTIATSEIENGAVTLDKISTAAQSSITSSAVTQALAAAAIKSITANAATAEDTVSSSSSYTDRISVTVNASATSRVLVFFGFSIKHSNNNNYRAFGKLTASNASLIGGDFESSTSDHQDYLTIASTKLDIATTTGTRTYTIQWRANSNSASIKDAYITAIEF